jgi:ferric-dicitrate binding protein FerR (iron transport regulator)
MALRRGDWCAAGAGTRARITVAGTEVELGPGARVLVEDVDRARLRLAAGEVEIRGDGLLISPFGVIEVTAGRGRVRAGPGGLEVENLAGHVTLADGLGERLVPLGARATAPSGYGG